MSSHRQTSQHSRQETFNKLPVEYFEKSSNLPNKLDTQAVVDLIRNADLFDLINISLNAKDLKTEQVEEFIQRALDKSQQRPQKQRAHALDPKQLELIFTPPSKISAKQHQQSCCSPSRIEMSNDENLNIIIDSDFKQSAGRQQFREWLQSQQPLQPSILENSNAPMQCQQALQSIQYSLQNQITNSKQQMFEELQKQIKHKLQLNDSCDQNQQPRDQVPRPYSEQATSPDTTHQYRHYHNQSFSDQDFVQETVQSQLAEAQKLRSNAEMPFKGDFSFHLTGMHESFVKKSEVSSAYSTLQDGTQASSEKQRQSTEESMSSSKHYEAVHHHHQQHVLGLTHRQYFDESQNFQMHKIQTKQTKTPQTQQQLQQSSQKKSLTRSTSNNRLQKSVERSRNNVNLNSTQSTKNIMLRSFINSTKNLENGSKTPRGEVNLSQLGQLTSRNEDLQQKERQSSILKALTDSRKCIDHRKQQVLNQLQLMNIKHLIEVERIKKPSQLAYITARLICQFFNIFRDSYQNQAQRQPNLHMEDLIEWSEIQKHINTQIIKQMNELLSSIKLKILTHEILNPIVKENITLRLIQLRQEYFTGDNLKLFKHLSTNKSLQVIINFVYNVMKYFLESSLAEHESNDAFNQTDSFRSFIESERNQNLNESNATPNHTNIDVSSAQKTPRLGQKYNLEKSPIQDKKLQKSASRCLLQRRDRSAILGVATSRNNAPETYQSMKNQYQCTTPRLGQTMILTNNESASRKPKISKHQSKSPLVRNGHRKQDDLSQSITSEQFKQKIVNHQRQRLTPQLGQIQDNSVNIQEKPLHLNYQLMIESSGFNEAIKKNAADIESNMSTTPQRKQIDMNIIEQLKQRRIEQRQRDASEDRSCERYKDL